MNKEVERFLAEIKRDGSPRDLHITRMCSSLVAVSNGEVIKATKPTLKYCPLAGSFYTFSKGIDQKVLKEKIVEAVEYKISTFGMFTDFRKLHRNSIAVPFGASEMMMYDLKKGNTEAAVTVCDGAGTVITSNPFLVQGIGARMNGVFYTSPIENVINGIQMMDGEVPFQETAKIDQAVGLRRALKKYKRVDLTVCGFGDDNLQEIREIESETDASVTVLVICTTGVSTKRVEEIKAHADLVWSCASKSIREIIGKEAKMQIATRIPVYALTEKALNFISSYSSDDFTQYQKKFEGPYIISGRCRQLVTTQNCEKIPMGDFETYIGNVEKLPIRSDDEPTPLI